MAGLLLLPLLPLLLLGFCGCVKLFGLSTESAGAGRRVLAGVGMVVSVLLTLAMLLLVVNILNPPPGVQPD